MDTWMSDQIEEKVEEFLMGTDPDEIAGSTTIRIAVGLITGHCLINSDISDEEGWQALDDAQKRIVARLRPKSKFARWLEDEREENRRSRATKYSSASPAVRRLMQRIEDAKHVSYVLELELKEPLAEALATFCDRAFVDRVTPFADGDEQAWNMFQAVEKVRSALKEAGLVAPV